MPSKSTPSLSARPEFTSRNLAVLPSAMAARFLLIATISGMTAMLSLRGKIAVSTIVAFGALSRHRCTSARRPRVMSSTLASPPGVPPTLFVPASTTMTFGLMPSSSPWSIRQIMFSIRSAPQPKSPAFQP